VSSTKTLYDYTAQTEEELSFAADIQVDIYDKEDPDWFLVRLKTSPTATLQYGFVPSNYLDDGEVESAAKLPNVLPGRPASIDMEYRRPPTPPITQEQDEEEEEEEEEHRVSVEEPASPSNAVRHSAPR
jgi:actin cytoskeleton-regulatory complex protein SLA1